MKIFEAGMLLCFGAAWPMNIVKSLRSRTAGGKSVMFQWAILIGYICGITNKLINGADIVLALYILNFVMVATDTVLIYRNRMLDRKRAAGEKM